MRIMLVLGRGRPATATTGGCRTPSAACAGSAAPRSYQRAVIPVERRSGSTGRQHRALPVAGKRRGRRMAACVWLPASAQSRRPYASTGRATAGDAASHRWASALLFGAPSWSRCSSTASSSTVLRHQVSIKSDQGALASTLQHSLCP